jgi:hypothetical protein
MAAKDLLRLFSEPRYRCAERSHYYRYHFYDSFISSAFLSLASMLMDGPAARSLRLGLRNMRMRRVRLVELPTRVRPARHALAGSPSDRRLARRERDDAIISRPAPL